MESNARYFRRRAVEEFTAAQHSVTLAARDRRIDLAKRFLGRLDASEANEMLFEWGLVSRKGKDLAPHHDHHETALSA